MINLVMSPFHDWKKCEEEGFRTRDGHWMQEFGRHPEVRTLLVINRPTSVSEMLFLRRSWHVRQGTTIFQENGVRISRVAERTFALDILIWEVIRPLLWRRRWIPYIFSTPRVRRGVETAIQHLDMTSQYGLFLSAPLAVPLVQQLNPSLLILDAQDNLLEHASYRDIPGLAEQYHYCLDHADLLYANSQETTRWFQQKRSDARHISNGVDTQKFDESKPHPVPADVENQPAPRIGYAGKMQEMFDVSLVEKAARRFPMASFILIGQILNRQHVKPLLRLSNVHFLGDKHYGDLPAYLAAFDICIVPYRQEYQHGGDPIKFYEYLAMGKPVVTTNIGNVRAFETFPQVRIADSEDEFLESLGDFLDIQQKNTPLEKRTVPAAYTWQNKADEMVQAMRRRLNRRERE